MAEETKKLKVVSKNNGEKNEKSNKPAKEKLGVRIKKFVRDYKSEIKKIVWPTKQQVIKNTGVVVFVIVVIAAFIGVLDLLFGMGIRALANL